MSIELEQLKDDGDTIELPDGRKLRVRIQPDEGVSINDFPDCYGETAWMSHDRQRPDTFTGAAEVLKHDYPHRLWWQPPADVVRGTPQFAKLRRLVLELLEFGFCYVALELLEGEDAYRRPIVVKVESLSGIDSVADGYLQEVLGELREQLDL
jgi:hypothetical protein